MSGSCSRLPLSAAVASLAGCLLASSVVAAIRGDFTVIANQPFSGNLSGTDNAGNTFDIRLSGVVEFPFGGALNPNDSLSLTQFFEIFTTAPNIFASGVVNGVSTPVFVYFRHDSNGIAFSSNPNTTPNTWLILSSGVMPGPPADDTVQQIVTTMHPMTWTIDFVADDQDRWDFFGITSPIPAGSELLDVDQSGDGLTVIDWSWDPTGRLYETSEVTYSFGNVPEPTAFAVWLPLAVVILIERMKKRRVCPAGNFRAH